MIVNILTKASILLAHYHLQAIAQLVEFSKVLLEVAVAPRILSRQGEFGRLS